MAAGHKASDLQYIVPVREESDVSIARKLAKETGKRAALREVAIAELVMATSEIARNILVHAGVGEVRLSILTQRDKHAVEVVVRDNGPGIPDIERALQEGYSTAGGLGLGLSSTQRLVDEFEVASADGAGTLVTLRKWQ